MDGDDDYDYDLIRNARSVIDITRMTFSSRRRNDGSVLGIIQQQTQRMLPSASERQGSRLVDAVVERKQRQNHPRVIAIGDVHGCIDELQDLPQV
jgi:hypothetical protein